jgi:23S rRNA (adenine2503-C2)-methyltransferase
MRLYIETGMNKEVIHTTSAGNELSPPEKKTGLVGLSREELRTFIRSIGEKPYRAGQIFHWIHHRGADGFDCMTNLSGELRQKLAAQADIGLLELLLKQVSALDGTVKILFGLADRLKIESVLIPPSDSPELAEDMRRLTLCVSTQVGCPAACAFCATGTMGFFRNLTAGEIIGQVLQAQRLAPRRISNIVFMGMGEPMLNYENVMKAIDILADDEGVGISPKRITVSTVGYTDKIRKMADEKRKAKLAISLHTLDDGLRTRIMPINKKHSIDELLDAARYYYTVTRQRVTFEYIYFEGLNDREEDIKALKKLSGKVACKLNIIPFHPVYLPKHSDLKNIFRSPTPEALHRFVDHLRRECGFPVMLRSSSGIDIDGACGQLAVRMSRGKASTTKF